MRKRSRLPAHRRPQNREWQGQDLALEPVQEQDCHGVGYQRAVDLAKEFPTSPLFILSKIWKPCAALVGTVILLGSLDIILIGLGLSAAESYLSTALVFSARLCGFLTLILAVYWELYRRNQLFWIEGFRLYVKKGLLPLRKASFPLLPVSEVYVDRGALELALGLATVVVKTPVGGEEKYSIIEGMDANVAESLQRYLAGQLDRMVFLSQADDGDEAEHYTRNAA